MDETRFMSFIKEWILNIRDHDHYLDKLGKERLRYLQDKAKPHSWVVEMMAAVPKVDFQKDPTRVECMVIAGSRYIADICRSKGYRTVLAGQGISKSCRMARFLQVEGAEMRC